MLLKGVGADKSRSKDELLVGDELTGEKLPSVACCGYTGEFYEKRFVFDFIGNDALDYFWLKISKHQLVCEQFL